MKIETYRQMKNVQRLAIHQILRPYNLLEHSYMVGILFMHFAKLEDIPYDINTLRLVLNHDVLETISGDMPYPAKNLNEKTKYHWERIESEIADAHPEMRPYTDHRIEQVMTPGQFDLFKACDLLELWIFIREEQEMGNLNDELNRVRIKCENIVTDFAFPHILKFMGITAE